MPDLAAADHDDLVGELNDALLMGNDDHARRVLTVELLKGLGQAGEAPQVDAGLGLVEDHQRGMTREQRRDLDALDLAAREGDVHLAVEIVVRAQADLREVAAALVLAELAVAAGDGQQVAHSDALEARGLLEAVADAALRARRDVEGGDVLAVPEDLTARRRDEAHDDLGERRFAAAVGAGKDDELAVGNGDADVLQNGLLTGLRRGDGVAYVLEL